MMIETDWPESLSCYCQLGPSKVCRSVLSVLRSRSCCFIEYHHSVMIISLRPCDTSDDIQFNGTPSHLILLKHPHHWSSCLCLRCLFIYFFSSRSKLQHFLKPRKTGALWLSAGLALLNANTLLQIWLIPPRLRQREERVTADFKLVLTAGRYQAAAATALNEKKQGSN